MKVLQTICLHQNKKRLHMLDPLLIQINVIMEIKMLFTFDFNPSSGFSARCQRITSRFVSERLGSLWDQHETVFPPNRRNIYFCWRSTGCCGDEFLLLLFSLTLAFKIRASEKQKTEGSKLKRIKVILQNRKKQINNEILIVKTVYYNYRKHLQQFDRNLKFTKHINSLEKI